MFPTSLLHGKFLFIAFCFCLALGSYFLRDTTRNWALLAGGMAFTAGADYFLIVRDAHVPGVALFCAVHIFYILRARQGGGRYTLYAILALTVPVVFLARQGQLLILAAVYAALFAADIGIHLRLRRRLHNPGPVLSGLILFALCDITVALANMPRYIGSDPRWARLFPLIWLFYLPSQVLLAISAIDYTRFKRSALHGAA